MSDPQSAEPVAWWCWVIDSPVPPNDQEPPYPVFSPNPKPGYEPLYPESALLAERQAREAAERMSAAHREHAQSSVENSASLNRLLSIAETRAEAAETSLAKAEARIAEQDRQIEQLTTEGLYISEQFSGAAGDIVKLRARIAELEAALRGLHSAVADMRVPQTTEEAGVQITLTIGPAFVAAGKALSSINKEP